MADDVTLPGTGEVVRTIEKGGKEAQVMVIDLGGAGAESLLTTSMPIQDGGNSITVDGTLAVTNAGITTIAGAVSGTEMQVDVITMPTVTIQDGGGAITVDGTVTANTGLSQPLTDTQLRATAVPVSVATVPSHAVTNAGTFAVQESGAALTALQLIDNMISGNEAQVDVVTMPVTHIIADSGTITAVTAISNALPAGDNNIGNVDVVTMPTVELKASTAAIGKLAANSGVDIGDVDIASIAAGTNNIGSFLPYTQPENFISGTTAAITDTTRTSLIAAQGDGIKTYLTQITVTNAHATVGTFVKIEDNTTTKYQAYAAPAGGGFSITFPIPLVGTANTAWNVSCVTTGGSVVANASGYKGA